MDDGRLGLLDFGCTKHISPEFCQAMAQAWSALLDEPSDDNYAQVRAAYLSLGVISPELCLTDFIDQLIPAITPIVNWQLEPFKHKEFNFSNKSGYPSPDLSHTKTLMNIAAGFHEDLPYFDRAFLGLMHLLKKLGATVVTGNPWVRNENNLPRSTNI